MPIAPVGPVGVFAVEPLLTRGTPAPRILKVSWNFARGPVRPAQSQVHGLVVVDMLEEKLYRVKVTETMIFRTLPATCVFPR